MDIIEPRRSVVQLIMIEIPGKVMTEETVAFIRECHPAGVVLFGTNRGGLWFVASATPEEKSVRVEGVGAPFEPATPVADADGRVHPVAWSVGI